MHFVVGKITKESYEIKASLVFNGIRYIFHVSQLIDLTGLAYEIDKTGVAKIQDNVFEAFHEKVHNYVSKPERVVRTHTVWDPNRNFTSASGVREPYYGPKGRFNGRHADPWSSRRTQSKKARFSWLPEAADQDNEFNDYDDIPLYDSINGRRLELQTLIRQVEAICDRNLESELLILLGAKKVLGFDVIKDLVVGEVEDYLHELAEAITE
jgi:hypothetical protein